VIIFVFLSNEIDGYVPFVLCIDHTTFVAFRMLTKH